MNFDGIEIQDNDLENATNMVVSEIQESIIKELKKKYSEWYDIDVYSLNTDTLMFRSPHTVSTNMLYNMQCYFDQILKYWNIVETKLPDNGINVTIPELLTLDGKSVLSDGTKSWWQVIKFLLDMRVRLKDGLRFNKQIMVNIWFQNNTTETQRYNQSTLVIKKMEELMLASEKEVYLRFYWKSMEIDSYLINRFRR